MLACRASSDAVTVGGVIDSDDAAELAEKMLAAELPRRWRHVRLVARRARWAAKQLSLSDDLAVAAWLHDIGYAPELVETGFHPLDGAHLADKDRPALYAQRLTVAADMLCDGFQADGEIDLLDASIGGALSLRGAHLAGAEVDRAAGELGAAEVDKAAGELGAAEADRAAGELGAVEAAAVEDSAGKVGVQALPGHRRAIFEVRCSDPDKGVANLAVGAAVELVLRGSMVVRVGLVWQAQIGA
jgi:hypothetical protein